MDYRADPDFEDDVFQDRAALKAIPAAWDAAFWAKSPRRRAIRRVLLGHKPMPAPIRFRVPTGAGRCADWEPSLAEQPPGWRHPWLWLPRSVALALWGPLRIALLDVLISSARVERGFVRRPYAAIRAQLNQAPPTAPLLVRGQPVPALWTEKRVKREMDLLRDDMLITAEAPPEAPINIKGQRVRLAPTHRLLVEHGHRTTEQQFAEAGTHYCLGFMLHAAPAMNLHDGAL